MDEDRIIEELQILQDCILVHAALTNNLGLSAKAVVSFLEDVRKARKAVPRPARKPVGIAGIMAAIDQLPEPGRSNVLAQLGLPPRKEA